MTLDRSYFDDKIVVFRPETIEMRSSKNARYLSLTVTINARSREQLDALYSELSKHPMVMMVL